MRILFLIITLLAVSSCSSMNAKRLSSESLISSSSELVAFVVEDQSVQEVKDWSNDDKPTKVNFQCTKSNLNCAHLVDFFTDDNIPSMVEESADGTSRVELVYERVAARDCPTEILGCAVSANALQMVSDHSQFTSPALSDKQDAQGAVRSYRSFR